MYKIWISKNNERIPLFISKYMSLCCILFSVFLIPYIFIIIIIFGVLGFQLRA
jgi:ABC-type transport system involved in multi-copper enzyme maturation permease subunit